MEYNNKNTNITMKRLFTTLVTFIVLCLTACSFQSCEKEAKYTVWTDSGTYAEFQTSWGTTLEDGYYKRLELSSDQWAEISKGLTSEGRHWWSEEEIKRWLIAHYFGDAEARKEAIWFTVVDHGFIVTRTGNLVYLILK